MLPQWHVNYPGHSTKGVGGRLHLNIHAPLNKRRRSGLSILSRHSVGTYQEKRAHTQLVRKTIGQNQVCASWSTRKKKKSAGGGINRQTFPHYPRKRKATTSVFPTSPASRCHFKPSFGSEYSRWHEHNGHSADGCLLLTPSTTDSKTRLFEPSSMSVHDLQYHQVSTVSLDTTTGVTDFRILRQAFL